MMYFLLLGKNGVETLSNILLHCIFPVLLCFCEFTAIHNSSLGMTQGPVTKKGVF